MAENKKIKASVIAATGYAGIEVVRLLLRHPNVSLHLLSSVSFEGKSIDEIYPNLRGICTSELVSADEATDGADVVFASLPYGLSEPYAEACVNAGVVFIDFGADFRLDDPNDYLKWYGKTYEKPELHKAAVYSIPELHREAVKNAPIIGNPGCYPTSATLGIAPALRHGLISSDGIIVDAKSGVTGAGRKLTQNTHFPEMTGSFTAYKAGEHRHGVEIEQTLSKLAGVPVKITFVPHLVPINRGIESTIYAKLNDGVSMDDVRAAYETDYAGEYFVRLMPRGEYANVRNVSGSNYCDISLHCDSHTNTLIVSSCIDNMVKGSSGEAIQNMNIRFGFDEKAGIDMIPAAF